MNAPTTRRIAWTFIILSLHAGSTAAQFAGPGSPAMVPPGSPPAGVGVMPASHGMPMGGGGPMFVDPASAYGYGEACDAYGNPIGSPFGGHGTGAGWDQCGPHYYDFSADFLYWRRDRSAEPPVDLVARGAGGPIVLGSDNLDMDYEPGFRVTGRLDLGPLSFVEAAYFGTFFWEESAQVTGNGDLFSVFSGFSPPGFLETDFADLAAITLESELHSSEINWRRYWVGAHPAVTGTWLMGARWVRLTEEFLFQTRVTGPPAAFMDYNVSTENDLVGFQAGGDMAVCLRQGLRLVSTGKAGIYNNRTKQFTRIAATTLPPNFAESADDNSVAFVGEGGVSVVADLLPSFSFRAGYEVLFLNSIALGANNFNSIAPFPGGGVRVPFVEDDGKALYHGFHAGVEYVW
jgi:hypothetical protein